MVTRPVIVIGAGGHAAVVIDALRCAGVAVLACTDADPARHGSRLAGVPVLGSDEDVLRRHSPCELSLVIGIGGTRGEALRQQVQTRLEQAGWQIAGVLHPAAVVSAGAVLGEGVQVLALAVVQTGARIGRGAIINTAAVVEHDAEVGEFAHVAPRAVLCGEVRLAAGVHVGAGAVVRQRVRLGSGVVVGIGAAVVADAAGPGVLVGVPARLQEGKA